MKFCCPGCLYAKSLFEGRELSKDYEEWFSHPEIQAQKRFVNSFALDLNLEAGPVLVSVGLDRDRSIVIRYSWSASGDQNGRRHSRRETCLVNSQQLHAMLSGSFMAVPNKDTKTFAIEADDGEPLTLVQSDIVCGTVLKVYAQSKRDFNLTIRNAEGAVRAAQPIPAADVSPSRRKSTGEVISSQEKQGRKESSMFKILSVVLACGCLVVGWFCYSAFCENEKLKADLAAEKADKEKINNEKVALEQQLDERKDFESNVKKFNKGMPRFSEALVKLERIVADGEKKHSAKQQLGEGAKEDTTAGIKGAKMKKFAKEGGPDQRSGIGKILPF